MLGLGKHIRGDMIGIGGGVGNKQNLARSGNRIDIDLAKHEAFGRRDKNISRTDDLVNFGDRRRAKRQRGDRLRSADAKNPVDAGNLGRGKNNRAISPIGEVMMISFTPATFAGITFIKTVEG